VVLETRTTRAHTFELGVMDLTVGRPQGPSGLCLGPGQHFLDFTVTITYQVSP
jgi:hypothetical protein